MEVSYPKFIDIRNSSYEKIGTAFPSNFVCENTKEGGTLSFTMPLSEPLIDVGSLVTYYWGLDMGGMITTRDIDIGAKKVTYSGKSWRGLLDNFIVEVGNEDRTITLESEISHPGCQTQLSGTTSGGIAYPNNGPYPLLHYNFEHFGLPFYVFSPFYLIDLPANYVMRVKVPLGTTLLGLLNLIEEEFGYNVNVTGPDHFFGNNVNPNEILNFWLQDRETYEETDGADPIIYDESKVIVTESWAYNEMYDGRTLHYLASDGTYKSQSSVMSNFPSDLMYPGIQQRSYWNPTERYNIVCQEELKQKRSVGGKLKSEIRIPLSDRSKWGIDSAGLGDTVKYHLKTVNASFEQALTGTKLELINGIPFITYILGG